MSPRLPLAVLIFGLCVSVSARADVITSYRTVEKDKPVSRSPETLVLASDDALLTETWDGDFGEDGAYYRRSSQLVQFSKNRIVTMDADLRIYAIAPLGPETVPGEPAPKLRITRLADEKILGYNTHHFYVDGIYQQSPFANGGTLARQEIWVLPAASDPRLPVRQRNFRAIEAANVSGDAQFLPEIQSGILIRQSVFDAVTPDVVPSKVVYVQELTALSIGELPASTFEIPPGYRQLSPSEYSAELGKNLGEALEREFDRQRNAT